MKRILLLFFFAPLAFSQAVRVDIPLFTAGPNVPMQGGPLPQALWLSNATIQICAHPATLSSCSYVTTYTDVTASVPCPSTQQIVNLPGATCSSGSGTLGNIGFWYGGGTVDYIVTSTYGTYGPYTVTGVNGSGNFVSLITSLPQTMAGGLFAPWIGTTYSVPVEYYGAVGNATGAPGVGHDDTSAIQACLNAIPAGQCMLQNKQYRITAPLTITRSNVGIGGVSYAVANSSLYPTPAASIIWIDSASADAIDAAGTDQTHNITYNKFTNFTISRTVIPTTAARGLSLQFSYGAMLQGITSNDSAAPFYFHGVGSQGTGYVENCAAFWGYNGFAENAAGNYGGFIVDSTGGVAPNNSFRIRNVFVAENSNISHTGGVITYGVDVSGSNINDFHSFHVETAGVDYGIVMGNGTTVSNSSDIFISEPVFDQTWVSALLLNDVIGGAVINGGDYVRSNSTTSNAPIIDIENSDHITVENAHLFSTNASTTGPSILVNNSGSIAIVGNDLGVNYGDGIDFTGTVGSTITANVINGLINGTGISLTGTSIDNVVSSNTINVPSGQSATNGILIDASSQGIFGVQTNQVGATGLSAVLNDASSNATCIGPCILPSTTQTTGQVVCIKASGPPPIYGTCTALTAASGVCSVCN